MANVFLDVTRLCRRLTAPTPDGVGRVEHAYLKWALSLPRAYFIIAGDRRIDLLDAKEAHRLFQTVEARWRGAPDAEARAETLYAEFIGSGVFERPSDRLRQRLRALPELPAPQRRTLLTRLLKAEANDQRRPLRRRLAAIARRYRLPGKGGPSGFAAAIGLAAADRTIAAEIAAEAPAPLEPSGPTPRLLRKANECDDPLYICVGLFPGAAPSALVALKKACPRFRAGVMLHDLIPARLGGPHGVEIASDVSANLRALQQAEATLIANSEATRRDYLVFASESGLPTCKVAAAPLGFSGPAGRAANAQAESAYFLSLGSLAHRKNTDLLARIWPRLKDRMGSAAPRLIVVGAEPQPALGLGDRLRRNSAADLISVETGVDDDRLAGLIGGARALLFPSFAEGWGLPLVEALAAGTPAICSDIPAFREAGQKLADYIDPLDGLGWLSAIENYASPDSAERTAQCARIRAFRTPTWEAHFRIVETALDMEPARVS